MDYQDVTGTHLENIEHDVYKLRMDKNGTFIQDKNYIKKIQNLEKKVQHPSFPKLMYDKKIGSKIDSCYGAELTEG